MRPAQAILRPYVKRALSSASLRYSVNINHQAIQNRSTLDLKDHVYFSKATAGGPGRNGFVRSWGDSPLELNMSIPRNSGGKGNGHNPEELFAMAYASCFVFLGHPNGAKLDGFALRVELAVEGCSDDGIIAEAHQFCPYSRALRESAEVKITKG